MSVFNVVKYHNAFMQEKYYFSVGSLNLSILIILKTFLLPLTTMSGHL